MRPAFGALLLLLVSSVHAEETPTYTSSAQAATQISKLTWLRSKMEPADSASTTQANFHSVGFHCEGPKSMFEVGFVIAMGRF